MRAMGKWAVAIALVGLLASAAPAQFRGGFGFPGLGFLASNASVQTELKVTDEQKEKLKDALGKVRDKHRDDFEKFRDLSQDERMKLMRTLNEENLKAIKGVLEDKQMKRLKQIDLQFRGASAFADPMVQEKLKMSEAQKSKIRSIGEGAMKKMAGLRDQGLSGEDARKQMTEIRKDSLDKTTAVLTDEQKKTWKEMTGKPFEIKFAPRPKQ